MWLSPVEHCVRDAGVAGSNPATPTRLLTISTPYRDSYRDRNVSATGSVTSVPPNEGPSQRSPETLVPSQPIFLIIEPVNRRGLFAARLAKDSPVLCTSRKPFADAARLLIGEGIDPETILISCRTGQDHVSLRSRVGLAAKITFDEHNGTVFANISRFPARRCLAGCVPQRWWQPR